MRDNLDDCVPSSRDPNAPQDDDNADDYNLDGISTTHVCEYAYAVS